MLQGTDRGTSSVKLSWGRAGGGDKEQTVDKEQKSEQEAEARQPYKENF